MSWLDGWALGQKGRMDAERQRLQARLDELGRSDYDPDRHEPRRKSAFGRLLARLRGKR